MILLRMICSEGCDVLGGLMCRILMQIASIGSWTLPSTQSFLMDGFAQECDV
jgi:hypothetical protein